MRKSLGLVLSVAIFGFGAPFAVADPPEDEKEEAKEPEAEEAPWYEEVSIDGFVSTAYSYNGNRPPSGTNQLRTFDVEDGSFIADLEVVLQKACAEKGDAGFRADLLVGSSIPKAEAASGLFRDPETGEAEDIDLQQAFLSYIAPAGEGLRLDVGKFVTHMGLELIDGYDGYNQSYTHSFLFGFAIPFTHTGIKATYPWTEKVSTSFLLVNGWDVVRDNNDKLSYGLNVSILPTDALSFYVNYVGGAERADDESDLRHVVDLIAVIKPTEKLTFQLNYDHGTEKDGAGEGVDATWWGAAGYARVDLCDRFSLNFRGEVFEDEDGVRTGTAQKLSEVTVTPELRATDRLVFRADLRMDRSNEDVFEDEDGVTDSQVTLALNAIYVF